MLELQKIAYKGASHQPDAPTLEFKDVYVSYESVGIPFTQNPQTEYALENISFRAEEGERIAVIGPNGAGKSTLFKLIAGILKPDRGTVEMFGRDPSQHICIAYVPQRSQINWSFPATVEDVVMMGRTRQIGLFRRPKKKDWEVVRASLERVNALHLAKKQIGELSGGQQQRVFIARALALRTNLLLLDEPLTGLDVPSNQAILQILDELRPDGVTVFVATHDINLAADRFDKVMLLNRKLLSFGAAGESLTTEKLLTAFGGHVHQFDNSGTSFIDDNYGDEAS